MIKILRFLLCLEKTVIAGAGIRENGIAVSVRPFNFRFISHTTRVSNHGLGLAVDINTLYNPYTKVVDGERIVEPVTGEPYLDREASFDYKIEKGDLCDPSTGKTW